MTPVKIEVKTCGNLHTTIHYKDIHEECSNLQQRAATRRVSQIQADFGIWTGFPSQERIEQVLVHNNQKRFVFIQENNLNIIENEFIITKL